MNPEDTKRRGNAFRLITITALLLGATVVATSQVAAWGTYSSWKSPGTPSICYATDDDGNDISGWSAVSPNAQQTLVATDSSNGCGLRTEASGKDSAGTVFSQKAVTASTYGSNSQTASVTTPRNIAKHRCRVEMHPEVRACILPFR